MFHKMIAFRRERKKERENKQYLKCIYFENIFFINRIFNTSKKKCKLFTLLNLFNY